MPPYEERFTAIEKELGIVANTAFAKLDAHSDNIYEIKERLGIDDRLDALEEDAEQTHIKLDAMNERLNAMETQMHSMNTRMDAMETQLNTMGSQIETMGSQIKIMDTRMNTMNTRLNRVESLLVEILDRLPGK
jgi:chromosome segregation ATPase